MKVKSPLGDTCLVPIGSVTRILKNSTTNDTELSLSESSQSDFKLLNKSITHLDSLILNNTAIFSNLGNLSLRSLDNHSLEDLTVSELIPLERN